MTYETYSSNQTSYELDPSMIGSFLGELQGSLAQESQLRRNSWGSPLARLYLNDRPLDYNCNRSLANQTVQLWADRTDGCFLDSDHIGSIVVGADRVCLDLKEKRNLAINPQAITTVAEKFKKVA